MVIVSSQPLLIAVSVTSTQPIFVNLCCGLSSVDELPSLNVHEYSVAPVDKLVNLIPGSAHAFKISALKSGTGLVPTLIALGKLKVSVHPLLVVMVSETV